MKENSTITAAVSVALGIIGVAILAVLVSNASQTANVFTGFSNALKTMFCTALSPVTGAKCVESVTSVINFPGVNS